MISYARSGAASVVIGVAILPAIAAMAALVQPRGARGTREQKAFACLFVAAAAGFLLYTAAKGVYLGPVANLIEERNLIYLVPLFLAGTAVWLSRRAVEPLALVAATAIVLWLVVTVPLDLGGHPASDAPSLEALGAIGWSGNALKVLLAGIAVLSAAIVLQRSPGCSWARARSCSPGASASEIYASRRSADYANLLALTIPRPFEWIDDATQGRSAVYVGQKIRQPTDIWLQSFWNPSLVPDADPGRDAPDRGDARVRPRDSRQRRLPPRCGPAGRKPARAAGHRLRRRGSGRHRRRSAGRRGRALAHLHGDATAVGGDRRLHGQVDGRPRARTRSTTARRRWVTVRLSREKLVRDRHSRPRDHLGERRRARPSGRPRVPRRGPERSGAEAAFPSRRHYRPHLQPRGPRSLVSGHAPARRRRHLSQTPRPTSRSGCLRTKRTIPRQCQSVRRVKSLRSVSRSQRWRTTAAGTYQRSHPARAAR